MHQKRLSALITCIGIGETPVSRTHLQEPAAVRIIDEAFSVLLRCGIMSQALTESNFGQTVPSSGQASVQCRPYWPKKLSIPATQDFHQQNTIKRRLRT